MTKGIQGLSNRSVVLPPHRKGADQPSPLSLAHRTIFAFACRQDAGGVRTAGAADARGGGQTLGQDCRVSRTDNVSIAMFS